MKEGFLSSASFVSRSSHPTSPIKHVGMEALGEFVACQCVGIWHLFLGLLAFVARGLEIGFTRLCYAPPKFGFDRFVTWWFVSAGLFGA